MIVFYSIIAIFDARGGDTFFSNPVLTVPILSAWVSGFLAFVTSIIAVAKEKAKSITVFLSMIVGLMVTLFGVMEILFPH